MRDSGGYGPNPENGNTYNFKVDGIYHDSANGMTVEEVWSLIETTDPGHISNAAGIYSRAASTLNDHANGLRTHASKLAGAWGGNASDGALQQMQQLHQTATNLAQAAQGLAKAMQEHSPKLKAARDEIHKLLQQKKQLQGQAAQVQKAINSESWLTKAKDFFTGDPNKTKLDNLKSQITALDHQAAQKLNDLSTNAVGSYNQMPTSVSKDLPPS